MVLIMVRAEPGILLANADGKRQPAGIARARASVGRVTSPDEIDRQNLICRVLDLGDVAV